MSSKFKKHPKNNYKKDQIHFLEKEKLEKYLSCPICQEILEEPTRITCGHTFCNKCISQWEKKSHNFQCPLCREYYDPDYSGKDLLAQNMINDANVSCIYKGCPWKDKLVNLNNHIQNCLFNPKKLPKFMKISNWFKDNNIEKDKEKENEQDNKNKTEEEEDNPLANLCSFNYTSSIKERVFSRNPNLVLKLFDKEENDENIKEKKFIKNIEKISDNDEVNEIYNCLILDEDKENNSKNKEKEKEKDKEKENKSENEQGKSLQGSSIMNIFISPNITISQNDFLGNKTDREGK